MIDAGALHAVLYAMMDAGFRSGERYVYADELAYLLGMPFEFEEEDGKHVVFDGSDSWIRDYPYPNNDLGIAIRHWKESQR